MPSRRQVVWRRAVLSGGGGYDCHVRLSRRAILHGGWHPGKGTRVLLAAPFGGSYPRSMRDVVFAANPTRPMLVAVAPPQTSSRG